MKSILVKHWLYILRSEKADKYYVGETSNLEDRLADHLTGRYKGSYTTQAKDWKVVLSIEFENITQARRAEGFIKRMNSKKFIEKLLTDCRWLEERFKK